MKITHVMCNRYLGSCESNLVEKVKFIYFDVKNKNWDLRNVPRRFSPTDSDVSSKVTLSVLQLPALTKAESLSCVFELLPPQPAVVTGTSISCQSPPPELLPPVPLGHGEEDKSPSVGIKSL